MLINVFLDFDDTIFPSHFMSKFYHCNKGLFVPPSLFIEKLQILDRLIANFISKHMSYCRFRIVTHASKRWLAQSLELLPILQRYIEWNYVTIIQCEEKISKQDRLYDIIAREKSTDIYFCCGDSLPDINAVPSIVKKLGLDAKIRSILFIKQPSIESLQIQWEKIHESFIELMKDETKWINRHFTVIENCEHSPDPNWYNVITLDSTFAERIKDSTNNDS